MIDAVTPREPSTAALPARWNRTDEWYGFLTNPRANGVRVLLTLDESTYLARDWSMGADHPIAWQHDFDGGRAWYTAGGHTTESYSEPLFLGHLLGGIQYALAKPAGSGNAAAAPKPAAKVAPTIGSLKLTARKGRVACRRDAAGLRALRRDGPCALEDGEAQDRQGRGHRVDRRASGRPLAGDARPLPTSTRSSRARRRAGCGSRRREVTRAVLATLAAVFAAASMAAARAGGRSARPRLHEDRPATATTRSPPAIQAVRELGAKNGFEVTATEDDDDVHRRRPRAVRRGDLPARRPARCSNAGPAGRVRGLHPRRATATSACTRPPTPSAAGPGTAASSAPGRRAIRRSSRPMIDVVTPRDGSTAALPARWSRTDEWYSWLDEPAGERRARPAHARREHVHAARVRDGRRPPDRVVARVRRRPGLVHAERAHRGVVLGAAVPRAPARRDQVRDRGLAAQPAGEAGARGAQVQVGDGRASATGASRSRSVRPAARAAARSSSSARRRSRCAWPRAS